MQIRARIRWLFEGYWRLAAVLGGLFAAGMMAAYLVGFLPSVLPMPAMLLALLTGGTFYGVVMAGFFRLVVRFWPVAWAGDQNAKQ
ncbi:MAG: hypothetical protein HY859_05080 [Caulobacterales bacterium]|nr:hypothetical protein [Caulobacterales bacterium]